MKKYLKYFFNFGYHTTYHEINYGKYCIYDVKMKFNRT